MDYVEALTFITKDERWKEKMAIGTGVVILSTVLSFVLIGLLGFVIVMGYCVRLLQNMRDGDQMPLPEWNDWGGDLTRGFKLLIVTFVWALPAILLSLPIVFGGIVAGSDSDALNVFGAMIMGLGYCLTILYSIALVGLTPGFTIRFAQDEQISSGLQFTAIWAWTTQHLGEIVMFVIALIVASFVIGLVGSVIGIVLCFVGLFVTAPIATLVTYLYQYNLLGQIAYKDRTGKPYYARPVAGTVPAAAPVAPAPPPAPAGDVAATQPPTSEAAAGAGDTTPPASDQPDTPAQ